MFDDPKALTGANWNDIHNWLTFLWIYLPIVLTLAFTLLVAHAFIPSLVSTGHLHPGAQKLRAPMTVFALLVLVAAVVVMVFTIDQTLNIRDVWDRFLI